MWIVANYLPVSLFSFRSGIATSSGAKTLLLPTPFAIRTALLDVAIRTQGLERGKAAFEWIKTLTIAIRPPEQIVITNLFTKILKPTRKEKPEKAMDPTIAFREYAHLNGSMVLAFRVTDAHVDDLKNLLPQVNYFGKRGSFFQLMQIPQSVENLSDDFILMDGVYVQNNQVKGKWPEAFMLGLLQMMDDWGDSLTFSKTNIYSDENIVVGKDRVRKSIILPYRLIRSSKSFSYYQKM